MSSIALIVSGYRLQHNNISSSALGRRKTVTAVFGLLVSLWLAGCGAENASSKPGEPWAPHQPSCLAPAKPGGGFDLTCRLATDGLAQAKLVDQPMSVRFKPGGVGAVAMAQVLSSGRDNADQLVAFSAGSILNIAQGKFGRGVNPQDVRWLAAAGVDYGAYVVRADAPWQNLEQLVLQLQLDPSSITFGAGGTVGSQDWMKTALLFRQQSLDPKLMRYVAFEGGGDSLAALLGGHVDVMPGDVAELVGLLGTGKIRVLAVLSEQRLHKPFAELPTAAEQGFAIAWPIFRGFYLGPDVSTEQYQWWQTRFERLHRKPEFLALQRQRGLLPLPLVGPEFANYVDTQAQRYRELAREFRLVPQ